MIGVIEYKAGNAPSVVNALESLGINSRLINTSKEIQDSNGIILPGVGSARATMESLDELNILDTLYDEVMVKKKYFLGICVGLQILFEKSEEGDTECLGYLKGQVKKFNKDLVKVPQIGWNETVFTRKDPILEDLSESDYFYFVNSFYVSVSDENIILGKTDYELNFTSMINQENIYATQFHAEKSGEPGLIILKNFSKLAGEKIC